MEHIDLSDRFNGLSLFLIKNTYVLLYSYLYFKWSLFRIETDLKFILLFSTFTRLAFK